MAIEVKVHANGDDALIAWEPKPWPDEWVGFALEKRNVKVNETVTLMNRIPASAKTDKVKVPEGGVPSNESPIRRCIWTDHSVDLTDEVEYRVIPMKQSGATFTRIEDEASEWTAPLEVAVEDKAGLTVAFNRGTLMSQVVSRFVKGDVSVASLKKLKASLSKPGSPVRAYLSGQARDLLLKFLADANHRGSEIYAALYELNDPELLSALEAFGKRGNVLLGNGSSTTDEVPGELQDAHLKVHHRDLSHGKGSSPSVHNKFVVEVSKGGKALRVLTGSTNWTTTGLCTQLNNALVIERPKVAERFHAQWQALVAAGDDLPDELKTENAKWLKDGPVSLAFAATKGQKEFAPVLDLINGAQSGILFLMFTPGQSPLLSAILERTEAASGLYIRGVVSTVNEVKDPEDPKSEGKITSHEGSVFRNGSKEPGTFKETLLPEGVPTDNTPPWALEEFQRKLFFAAGLNAIVHSKAIVIDPFSPNCAVITGSHNFSPAASQKNDENLVIVRGDQALAQSYAVHMQGVYDHYAWRVFLMNGGDPTKIFQTLASWKNGPKHKDLQFWLQ